jgi:hypothetical protein
MTVTQQLKRLREDFENEGESIADIEISAALLISDVCESLGLKDSERREVLGRDGEKFVDHVQSVHVRLSGTKSVLVLTKHNKQTQREEGELVTGDRK